MTNEQMALAFERDLRKSVKAAIREYTMRTVEIQKDLSWENVEGLAYLIIKEMQMLRDNSEENE